MREEPREPLAPDRPPPLVALEREGERDECVVDDEVGRPGREPDDRDRHVGAEVPAGDEDARRRQRRERERADVEEHVLEPEPAGAPLDRGDRHRERQRDARPEERRARERADGADGDRADVRLERERLADPDQADDGEEAEELVGPAHQQAEDPRPRSERADGADEQREPRREGEEARAVRGVPASLPMLLGGRRQRDDVLALLRHGNEPIRPVGADQDRLRAHAEDAVPALELGAVDGEVGLVDELVRVVCVLRVARDADRDRGADRLARGLDVEGRRRDGAPDPLGELERLLGRGLGQEDAELLPAEARRDVVVAKLRAEDLGDPLQDGVAGEVAVAVVDVAEQVEVGHDQRQRPLEALGAAELLGQRGREVARVEEAGLRIDAGLGLELRDGERAVDEDERREPERDQPRVQPPEGRDADAEAGEDELGREPVEGEELGLTERVRPGEVQHHGEQDVVQEDERERRGGAGERLARVRGANEARVLDPVRHRPGGQAVERVVRDVEALDVPGLAARQPLRNVLDERDQRDERRRQKQDGRDEEDVRRLEAVVPRRLHREELRHGGARGEDDEGRPLVAGGADVREERRGDRRRERHHDAAVDDGARRQLAHRQRRAACGHASGA